MDKFLDALCDGELDALIITGRTTDQELKNLWVLLLSEYYELRGDMDGLEQWRLNRDIIRLQDHLFRVQRCISLLSMYWSEVAAKALNQLGYFFFPEEKKPLVYLPELNAVMNQSKTKFIELKQLIKQQEDRLAKASKKKPTREYYERLLLEMEEVQGVSYTMETLTVAKFVQLEKKYSKHVERLQHGK